MPSSYLTAADLAAALPQGVGVSTGLLYANTAPVVVNTATPTSVFTPGSAAARTMAAGTLTPGRMLRLTGQGIYSVPTGNLNTADITLKVGAATIVAITTPAAPVGTNAGILFSADLIVVSTTTIICTGLFQFIVAGTTTAPVQFSSITPKTFDPTVANLIEVLGDWNTNAGALNGQTTSVQTAFIQLMN